MTGDRTAYDVWYSYWLLSGIAMVSMSIYLFTVSSWSQLLMPEVRDWCLSDFKSLCFVPKRYIIQQVSQEVNRKFPPRNITVQLLTPYTDPKCHNAQHHSQTDILQNSMIGYELHNSDYNKLNTFSNLKLVSWRFYFIWRLLQNWKWVDSSPQSVISVEMSWFAEKKLGVTSRQKVWPCVAVHTFVLALANRDCLLDPSGLAVRFVPYHLG